MISPLQLYAAGLRGEPYADPRVRLADGTLTALALKRYLGPADETEEQLLGHLAGPVLDVGCGPGRHLHALAARGVFALGVDLSPVAVELARGRGGRAVTGSIFGELPGNGMWRSALLLDGNIGIGGAPTRLLARIGTLLSDGGELLVELDPPQAATVCGRARIETGDAVSSWFPWARVSVADIGAIASAVGFTTTEAWAVAGRWFARLVRTR